MPLDFGVPEMLAAEYDRFLAGLADLSDGGQRAARAAAARIRPGAPAVRTISVPAWDDVVHLTPRPQITSTMREAHYAARRAGVPSPLAPELQEEIARRGRRARSIQSSAAPEYAQAYGQVMTAIDNVQDLLTTVTTVGRFSLVGGARLLDGLGRVAGLVRPFGVGPASKLAGRVVPILGPILLAADILKLITWLGLAMFPAYAAICAGLPAAVAAGALPAAQALLGKRAGKQKVGVLGKMNPWAMTARLDRAKTLRSWRPSIYNLMEVAQTTDQLFGVGVSFGGLVGVVTEAAFSTEAARRGQAVEIRTDEATRSAHRVLARALEAVPTAALPDLRAAAATLAHGPIFQRVQETFTLEEHVDALVAESCAWSLLRPILERPELEELVALALESWWAPPAAAHPDTRAIVLLETGAYDGAGRWPLPGTPERVRGESYYTATAPEVARGLAELLLPREQEPVSAFLGAVATQVTDRAMIVATGSREAIRLAWAPDWALLEALALAGRVPIASEDEGKLMTFWTSALGELERQGRSQLSGAEFDRLAEAAEISLLRVP